MVTTATLSPRIRAAIAIVALGPVAIMLIFRELMTQNQQLVGGRSMIWS